MTGTISLFKCNAYSQACKRAVLPYGEICMATTPQSSPTFLRSRLILLARLVRSPICACACACVLEFSEFRTSRILVWARRLQHVGWWWGCRSTCQHLPARIIFAPSSALLSQQSRGTQRNPTKKKIQKIRRIPAVQQRRWRCLDRAPRCLCAPQHHAPATPRAVSTGR